MLCDRLLNLPVASVWKQHFFFPHLWAVLPHQSSTFHWQTRQAQITLEIWVTATRQMMTGRCLRPQARVYNYAQDCRRRGREGCRASVLSELSPQHRSVCPARHFCSESPGAKLEALRGNFTLPRRLHSHFRSPKVSDRDRDTSHNTQIHTHARVLRRSSPAGSH